MMTITQAKFTYGILSELSEYNKDAFAMCTMADIQKESWICEFKNMSLMQIAEFISEFFKSPSFNATQVTFNIMGTEVSVKMCDPNNAAQYLALISKQINIG